MSLLSGLVDELSSAAANPGQASAIRGIMGVLSSPEVGGLPGLMSKFQQSGLEGHMASWVSNGANLPISTAQIQQVLGNATVQKLAEEAGLSTDELSTHLAAVLPSVVDHLTPNGTMPQAGGLLDLGLSLFKKP